MNTDKSTGEHLDAIAEALLPQLADFFARPHVYEIDWFRAAWHQKLHAAGCVMAAFRRCPVFNENHLRAVTATVQGHWFDELWRPPRDLEPSEWDDMETIAKKIGVAGMRSYRTYWQGKVWVVQ